MDQPGLSLLFKSDFIAGVIVVHLRLQEGFMFSHPVSISGYCITLIGGLLAFIPRVSHIIPFELVGLMLLFFGPLLVLAGILARGFLRVALATETLTGEMRALALSHPEEGGKWQKSFELQRLIEKSQQGSLSGPETQRMAELQADLATA